MFIIISGGPNEGPFSKYFETYEQAEQLLLENGFEKQTNWLGTDYHKEDWESDFKIDGENVGFQAYITELKPYTTTGDS